MGVEYNRVSGQWGGKKWRGGICWWTLLCRGKACLLANLYKIHKSRKMNSVSHARTC